MNDRELLKLAAKAAGVYLEWDGPPTQWQPMYYQGKTYHSWNPLTDDGDALRLAVKLQISVFNNEFVSWVAVGKPQMVTAEEIHNDNPYAATRRAIVRAAAEIGKGMK